MFVLDFICEKYVLLIETFGLAVVMAASVHIPKRIVRWTAAALALLLVDAAMIRAELYTQTFETLSPWRVVLSYAIYLIQPLIMIILTQITSPLKKSQWWLILPWFISIPAVTTSQVTRFVCFFDGSNHWNGGLFSLYPYVIFGFYAAVFLILNLLNFKKTYRSERFGIVYVVLSGLLGVVLFTVFTKYDVNDFSDIFAAEIVLYYLFLYIHAANIDTLTGLLNRQCFYRDLRSQPKSVGAVASVDMNELKWLNDTEGHGAGDAALRAVAGALNADSGVRKTVYRVGGDEFEILYHTREPGQVAGDIALMREKLAETPYVCAFGYACRTGPEKLDELVKIADRAMYEDKSQIKKEILEKGGKLHRRVDDLI